MYEQDLQIYLHFMSDNYLRARERCVWTVRVNGARKPLLSLKDLKFSSKLQQTFNDILRIWKMKHEEHVLHNLAAVFINTGLCKRNMHSYTSFTHLASRYCLPVSSTAGCRSRKPCGCVVSTSQRLSGWTSGVSSASAEPSSAAAATAPAARSAGTWTQRCTWTQTGGQDAHQL